MSDRILTIDEAAEVLKCGRNAIYTLFQKPDFPVYKNGKIKQYVREGALWEYVKKHETKNNLDLIARMKKDGINYGSLEQIFHVHRVTIRSMLEDGWLHPADKAALEKFLNDEEKRQQNEDTPAPRQQVEAEKQAARP